MKFRTLFAHGEERYTTNAGDRYQIEFMEVITPEGEPGLKEVGRVDLWSLHQQDRDSVDLPTIVARYRSGDISALDNGAKPLYYDRTMLPDDPVLAANLVNDLKIKFGDLGSLLERLKESGSDEGSKDSDSNTVSSSASPDVSDSMEVK